MTIFAEKQFQAEEDKLPEILGWVEETTMEYLSMDAALKMQLADNQLTAFSLCICTKSAKRISAFRLNRIHTAISGPSG